MAGTKHEAYEAGFTAGAATPRISVEQGWANYNTAGQYDLPIWLFQEFKRGFSSALSYRMASY